MQNRKEETERERENDQAMAIETCRKKHEKEAK